MKAKKLITNSICHVVLAILSVIWVLPIFYVILTSFREESGSYKSYIWPRGFTLDNYAQLIEGSSLINFKQWFVNTFVIAIFSALISTFLVLCVSYVMSRLKFKMRRPFLNIALVLGMFPGFMGMTAIYIIMTQLGLIDKLESLIFYYSATAPLGYMVQKGYFDSIPNTIFEAARLDGATNLQVFTKVTLPLSKSMLVYTVLTQFAWPWSDVLLPKLLLKDRNMWTVAVGLFNLPETHFARFAAGAVFIAIPIVILYFCLVKHIVNGLTAGSVKG